MPSIYDRRAVEPPFPSSPISLMRISSHGMILCALLCTACSSDETPADIAQKSIPEIAQELIQRHNPTRLEGMTPKIEAALAEHPEDDTTFAIGAPDLNGETGISFSRNEAAFVFSP